MSTNAPFLEIPSFSTDETIPLIAESSDQPISPFMSLYESETTGDFIDPETQEYVVFLNELQDDEFHDALSGLVNEAVALVETRVDQEQPDLRTRGNQSELLLDHYFAPLVDEAELLFETLATEFSHRDINSLTDSEIEAIVDQYQSSSLVTPGFDNFFGRLKKLAKKVARKARKLVKKGIKVATSLGLGPILRKLKALIKPLLKRVIKSAIGKLPAYLQPVARKLAKRVPFLKEFDDGNMQSMKLAGMSEVTFIQEEFNQQIANLVFASSEIDQELEIAQILNEQFDADTDSLHELDQAREQFVNDLQKIHEGEDPTPYVEQFLPAILPALRLGIRLIGRKKVVDFLARILGKLVTRFVGPTYAKPLSRAIVDAGMRLIRLETTAEDETRAAAAAVGATIEDTVRRVAALPEYILDNQELLEGFAVDAFEQAAAANMPPILTQEIYKKRPDLVEARKYNGVWMMMPHGRKKRYKKFTRKIPISLIPHKASEIETFEGSTLETYLEETMGILPGEEVEAVVHLFEVIPGTRRSEIARMEAQTTGFDAPDLHQQLQPLTREAAELLLSEADLGRDIDTEHTADSEPLDVGQRLYYLEIPGHKQLRASGNSSDRNSRRQTTVSLTLDFPANEVHLHLYLSEIRAQGLAVKLRQQPHTGSVITRLAPVLQRGLRRVLSGGYVRGLKLIHEALLPGQRAVALQRLPTLVLQGLARRLQEWTLTALVEHFRQSPTQFINAADNAADGVTIMITFVDPPGFTHLRKALKGHGVPLTSLGLSGDIPKPRITIVPGYSNE